MQAEAVFIFTLTGILEDFEDIHLLWKSLMANGTVLHIQKSISIYFDVKSVHATMQL